MMNMEYVTSEMTHWQELMRPGINEMKRTKTI